MNRELDKLMARISALRDEELAPIAGTDLAQYRPEAVIYARAELRRRGICSTQVEETERQYPDPGAALRALAPFVRNAILARIDAIGFIIGVLPFALANFQRGWSPHDSTLDHVLRVFGFPFDLWEIGGYAGGRGFLPWGFAADAMIAICAGHCAAWTLRLASRALLNREAKGGVPRHESGL